MIFWSFVFLSVPFARWYVVSDMTKSRSAAGVALLDNEIFVVGGHDGLQIFDSVSKQSINQKLEGQGNDCD